MNRQVRLSQSKRGKLFVRKLSPLATVPTVANPGDIGIDVHAASEVTIPAGGLAMVGTGISVEFSPPAGALLGTRSSMAAKGLDVRGGWIDAGYRGEIKVIIKNDGETDYKINLGDKIAQMMRVPVVMETVKETEFLSNSERGEKSFGSSGR